MIWWVSTTSKNKVQINLHDDVVVVNEISSVGQILGGWLIDETKNSCFFTSTDVKSKIYTVYWTLFGAVYWSIKLDIFVCYIMLW